MSRTAWPFTRTTVTIKGTDEVWAIPEIPLTTIWTPPGDCSSIVQSPSNFAETTCSPPNFLNAGANPYNYGYYSPGICPSAYTVGCVAIGDGIFVPPPPSHTVGFCVPESWTCSSTLACVYRLSPCPFSYTTFFAFSVSTDEVELIADYTLAPAFQIRWHSSDLTVLERDPLTPGISLETVSFDGSSASTPAYSRAVVETGTSNTPPTKTETVVAEKNGSLSRGSAPRMVGMLVMLFSVINLNTQW